MEAIGRFASGVAHDFNNILTVISGYGFMVRSSEDLPPQLQEPLDQIVDATDKAAQLTRDLLAFSRKKPNDPQTENVNDLVNHVQKFLKRIIGEDIQLMLALHQEGLWVKIDAGQFEQVLMNLATNARDAMPGGGVLSIATTLQQRSALIGEDLASPAPYAVISVSDTGSGMDEQTCKRIFEPFFTTKECGKGTGLGMAVVHGIVTQHRGVINVYSEPGTGTTFRICLPLVEGTAAKGARPGIETVVGGTETVLVAEDDAGVRKLVEDVLVSYGYQVILAADGEEVVERFRENRNRISLVFMDLIMPKKGGDEACRELRALDPGVRVLFSSGYTMDVIQTRWTLEEGAELVTKPIQPLELLKKVRELLDR
jgi:CheY-like chemotaxis protein